MTNRGAPGALDEGVESPGLCYLYYIFYMEKWKLFILYALGVCVGVAIGYMMQGCKATEKCDAYSKCAK
jgi:hypothetical protein